MFVDGGARRGCGNCGCAWAGGAGKSVSKQMADETAFAFPVLLVIDAGCGAGQCMHV